MVLAERLVRVEDVVMLEERVVGLDALLMKSLELSAVFSEAARRVEVERTRPLGAHVPEGVDDPGRSELVRPCSGAYDLVSDPELELTLEHVERVAVPSVEVGLCPATGLDLELEQRKLWTGGLDHVRSDPLTPTCPQDDRGVHCGSGECLLDEALPIAGLRRGHMDPLAHRPAHAGIEEIRARDRQRLLARRLVRELDREPAVLPVPGHDLAVLALEARHPEHLRLAQRVSCSNPLDELVPGHA